MQNLSILMFKPVTKGCSSWWLHSTYHFPVCNKPETLHPGHRILPKCALVCRQVPEAEPLTQTFLFPIARSNHMKGSVTTFGMDENGPIMP